MTSATVFDRAVYDLLASELGEQDAAEVLQVFLADTRAKIARLSAPAPDPLLVESEAHAIKSSAATFGFQRLSAIARALEERSPVMDAGEMTVCIARLRQAFAEVCHLSEGGLSAAIREFEA
jgi:HPt (histidine-containing phosphotransfer) domain-containing protein